MLLNIILNADRIFGVVKKNHHISFEQSILMNNFMKYYNLESSYLNSVSFYIKKKSFIQRSKIVLCFGQIKCLSQKLKLHIYCFSNRKPILFFLTETFQKTIFNLLHFDNGYPFFNQGDSSPIHTSFNNLQANSLTKK